MRPILALRTFIISILISGVAFSAGFLLSRKLAPVLSGASPSSRPGPGIPGNFGSQASDEAPAAASHPSVGMNPEQAIRRLKEPYPSGDRAHEILARRRIAKDLLGLLLDEEQESQHEKVRDELVAILEDPKQEWWVKESILSLATQVDLFESESERVSVFGSQDPRALHLSSMMKEELLKLIFEEDPIEKNFSKSADQEDSEDAE